MQTQFDASKTIEQIHQKYGSIINVNEKHKKALGVQDRIALFVTNAIGTMYAVYFFAVCMAGWMIWQSLLDKKPFDPYPFAFLLFLGNIVQLLLMPLIMVGQNLQGKHAELRSEHDYQTDKKAEQEIETILLTLENQQKMIMDLLHKIEILENRS